jgi:hypothetical protein
MHSATSGKYVYLTLYCLRVLLRNGQYHRLLLNTKGSFASLIRVYYSLDTLVHMESVILNAISIAASQQVRQVLRVSQQQGAHLLAHPGPTSE